ncbi:MAG: DUF2256 domain-containing protein [Blastocatellia bacterium]
MSPPRKGNLPTRICVVCQRPFEWRRKWRAVWEEVRYCSDACRRRRSSVSKPARPPSGESSP